MLRRPHTLSPLDRGGLPRDVQGMQGEDGSSPMRGEAAPTFLEKIVTVTIEERTAVQRLK